jgi:hypothetical protein
MNFHGHHPNQACLLLLLLRFFSSSPSMSSEASALIFCLPKQHFLYLCIYSLRPSQWFANISLVLCAAVSFILILLLLVSFLDMLVRAPRGQETRNKKVLPPAHRSIWISNRLQTAAGICLNSGPGGRGMRQLLKVTHVGVQQRIVSPPPCHPPTTTTTTTATDARARSLARSRVGPTAGKCFPVASGGGYLMVLITSGSGNSGTQPPRKKEPPDARLSGTQPSESKTRRFHLLQ